MQTLKILAFFALSWVVGMLTMNLMLRDIAWWWVTIPGFALIGFAWSRLLPMLREKANREQLFLAMLIMMLATQAIYRLWPWTD